MKIASLLSTLFLAVACTAFGRVGETTAELDARYGKPKSVSPHTSKTAVPETETRTYELKGFTVEVEVWKGRSHAEDFSKVDKDQAAAILAANAPGGEWEGSVFAGRGTWSLGENLTAWWVSEIKLLHISTREYSDAKRARKVAQVAGF